MTSNPRGGSSRTNEEGELINGPDAFAYLDSEVHYITLSSTNTMERKPATKKKQLQTSVLQYVYEYDEHGGHGDRGPTNGKQRFEQCNMSLVRMLKKERGYIGRRCCCPPWI